jgi:SAM-dependent methyltransferase
LARPPSYHPASNGPPTSISEAPVAAIIPIRIITINPPPPEPRAAAPEAVPAPPPAPLPRPAPVPEEVSVESLRLPDGVATLEESWTPSEPLPVELDSGDSASDTLEALEDDGPSTPVAERSPGALSQVATEAEAALEAEAEDALAAEAEETVAIEPDGEEVRFEDETPTPSLPLAEVEPESTDRRSEPGEAPEISLEEMVAVEAAPPATSVRPAPPIGKRPIPLPPKPPLVIVPPQLGNVAPQSGEAATRRKGRLWWEDFFNDDYLRTLEKVTDDQIMREVDFIEESLGIERGGAVLDLGCGTGRHAVELACRGYEVVGFDLSLAMLARAGDEAQDRGAKLNFVQGDMREMTFEEQFDGVFCWNTSFGYFEEEKNAQVVDRVHRALKAGGLFLLDVINREFLVRQSPSLAWFEGEGCVCMDEMIVDFITSRMRVKRTMMLDDGRSREVEYSMRTYSLHELGKILHEHGFKVCEVSGRLATPGVYFGNESPRTIILAEKK